MISRQRQRVISIGIVAVAFVALGLAAYYQDDNKLDDPNFVGIEQTGDDLAVGSSGASGAGSATTLASTPIGQGGPIERFLPDSGDAVACREPVGVDLVPGYAARLTINGREVPETEMNVNLNPDGSISSTITASRSIGQYTFMPEDSCPNGKWLRPVDNVLDVCVYRVDDPAQACSTMSEYVFSAA